MATSLLTKVFVLYPEGNYVDSDIDKYYTKVFVPSNKFCESKVIADLDIAHDNNSFIGVIRYDYKRNVAPSCCDFGKVAEIMHGSYDVVGLYPFAQQNHNMYQFAETCHPGFMVAWERLMKALGENDWAKHKDGAAPAAFYCNMWMMKADKLAEFQGFLRRALEVMDSDAELVKLLNVDSKYKDVLVFLDRNKAREVYGGVEYYPLHAFIQERLVCYWVHSRGLRLKLLTPDASEFHSHVFIKSSKKGGRLL